jgi:predicted O-methyltransferase YrrM
VRLTPKIVALVGLALIGAGFAVAEVREDPAPLIAIAALVILGAVIAGWRELDRSLSRRVDGLDAQQRSIAANVAERVSRVENVVQLRGTMGENGLLRGLRREFSQVEALAALYVDVRPRTSLPQTRVWAASPDVLHALYTTVRRSQPRLVLECGSGASTLVLAYGVRACGAGRVVALEHDPEHAARTRRMLEDHELGAWAEVRDAPLVDVTVDGTPWRWYDPDALPDGDLDVVFVDGPPGHAGALARYPAGPLLLPRLSPGGVLLLDDVRRAQEAEVQRRWAERSPELQVEVLPHEKGTVRFTRPVPSG